MTFTNLVYPFLVIITIHLFCLIYAQHILQRRVVVRYPHHTTLQTSIICYKKAKNIRNIMGTIFLANICPAKRHLENLNRIL